MKRKSFKRVLAAALVTTMVFGSALTANAASGGSAGSGGSNSSESTVASEAAASVETEAVEMLTNASTVSAGGTVNLAGTSVKSSIAGASTVKSCQGVAVITPLADLRASLGLTSGQTPFVMSFDTDAKKSPLAMQCVNAAIASVGGSFVTAINVELGIKENGKFVSLKDGSAAMSVGLPKGASTAKAYYVVCVQPGGFITVLEDQDTNPNTVTFTIKAGLGTYALAAK